MAFSILGILAVLLEIVRPIMGLLLTLIVIDLVLLALAWRETSRARWREAILAALASGLVLAGLAFITLPTLTGASFADLAGWLDYLALTGLSLGFGAALAAFSYPGWQLLYRR